MGLRGKLFFWIGSLFLLTAITSYVLPRLFIKQDVLSLRTLFEEQVQKQREEEQSIRKKLFNERIIEDVTTFNGNLLYVDETQSVRDALNPNINKKDEQNFWNQLSTLISYNPRIGLVNISNGADFHVSVAIDNATLYSSQAILLSKSCILVVLKSAENQIPESTFGPFIGIRYPLSPEEELLPPSVRLPEALSTDGKKSADSIYYLYPASILGLAKEVSDNLPILTPYILGLPLENLENPQEAEGLISALKNSSEKIEKVLDDEKIITAADFSAWLLKNKPQDPKPALAKTMIQEKQLRLTAASLNQTQLNTSVHKSDKLVQLIDEARRGNIIREYISYFLTAIKGSPFDESTPLGGTSFFSSIEELGNTRFLGGALLNQDIFFNEPLFSAKDYFLSHLPPSKHPPIAEGVALIDSSLLSRIFIANSLLLVDDENPLDTPSNLGPNPPFLTLGGSILAPIRSTALFPDEMVVFLNNDGTVRNAIDNYTNAVPNAFFSQFSFVPILDSDSGHISIRNISYHYLQLENHQILPVRIFLLIPDALEPIYTLQKAVSNKMISIYQTLSYQLLIATLALLGIALVILGFLSRKITKPVSMLAKATEGIVQGHYSDIHLPELDGGKDEIASLTTSFANMIKGLQDKEKIRGLLDKVVSKEIATEILKGSIHLGGESKVCTVLFSDIRNFTHSTERLDPQLVINHLNTYMTMMTNIIELEGGVIDKYVGDEIMALYGAPVEMPDGAMRAIKTAILMLQKLKTWNEDRVKEGLPAIEIGIGIHTGKVVAGNMGAETRLNYTVLGANVNLASRLCSAAEPMEIRVSKVTLDASGLKDSLDIQELPPQNYKGFSEPIVTYVIKGFNS